MTDKKDKKIDATITTPGGKTYEAEIKTRSKLNSPITLEPYKPINFKPYAPKLKTDETNDGVEKESIIELRNSITKIFLDRFNEQNPKEPTTNSYKELANELSIDWRTLENFHNGGKVANKVVARLIEKFDCANLLEVVSNIQLIEFIDDKSIKGMIIDVDIQPLDELHEKIGLLEEARNSLEENYFDFWTDYPLDKIEKLKRKKEFIDKDVFSNLKNNGFRIFAGELQTFMIIPEDSYYAGHYKSENLQFHVRWEHWSRLPEISQHRITEVSTNLRTVIGTAQKTHNSS